MDDELNADDLDNLSSAMDESGNAESTEDESTEPTEADSSESAPSNEPDISHAQFMQLEENESAEELPMKPIQRMYDVKVNVEVVLGKTKMPLEEILKLQSGSVVELNKLAGDPVDVIVNKRLIAKAEVVVIDDSFGIKITEISGSKHKLASL